MRVWIVGHEVGLVPAVPMFEASMAKLGMVGHVQVRDVAPRLLAPVLSELRQGVVDLCVVGRPYQVPMAQACDQLSVDAKILGAVNTIVIEKGHLNGENTEALGFELGLSMHRMWPEANCQAVVLGAGNVAAAVTLALSRVPAGKITICSRREAAALDLVDRLAQLGPVRAMPWNPANIKRALATAHILVNCTSADLTDLPLRLHDLAIRCTVVDMRVAAQPSNLVAGSLAAHRRACDGFETHLYQQMLGFARAAHVEPAWDASRLAFRAALDNAPDSEIFH